MWKDIHFSRFDRAIAIVALVFSLLILLVIWRGDQIGLQVVAQLPSDGSTNISTLTDLRLTFSQPLLEPDAELLTISPPISGSTRWQGKTLIFEPDSSLQAGVDYVVSLPAGLSGEDGRLLLEPMQWTFRTNLPRILYLAPDADNQDQLFVKTVGNEDFTQLSAFPQGVWDYALSPDGTTVAAAAIREDGASDLWLVSLNGEESRQLVACEEGNCTGPSWSPDGRALIYSRQGFLGPPRLWWVDVATGEKGLVFDDSQIIGYAGRWSPDGKWISHIAPMQGVRIFHVDQGDEIVVPSQMGESGTWSPESDALVLSEIIPQGERFSVHLFRVNLASGEIADLSGAEAEVEDTSPAWSPDGQSMVFSRKLPQVGMGSQLWLMRPDGSEARALTEAYDTHHGAATWSTDGRYLLFQRFNLRGLNTQPGVWMLEVTTGEMQELVKEGRMPSWAP